MSTYRERRLARAEKLRDWSDARVAKQPALSEAARGDEAATGIPFGQPILVGHHSEGRHRAAIKRLDRAMSARVENSRKASSMAARADSIEAQAENAIYSDDPDAIERLTAKLAALEAERETMKADNAAFRKEHREMLKGKTAYERDCAVPHPRYSIANLGGNISRQRKRLAFLKAEAERPADDRGRGRSMEARYGGACADCGAEVAKGDSMVYYRRTREVVCTACEGGNDG